MSLTLSDRELAALCALQETLLSPFAHDTTNAWQSAIAAALAQFFQADRAICTLPDASGAIQQASAGIDPLMAAQFSAVLAGTRPGSIVFRDPVMDQAFFRMASAHVDVWNDSICNRVSGVSIRRSRFFNEVVVPAGVANNTMASVSLPSGQGLLGVAYVRQGGERYGDATVQLCQLILPAFRTGLASVLSLGDRRAALELMLQDCQVGILVRDLRGIELHRNSALERMLSVDPEGSRILTATGAVVRGLFAVRRSAQATSDSARAAPWRTTVKTAVGSYSLGASYLPAGTFACGDTAVVTVACNKPLLPETRELREYFGLTPREVEVALLLAGGASDREIATRLGISPHTARKHAEHIFDKVDVHSRKAFLLQITRATGTTPNR